MGRDRHQRRGALHVLSWAGGEERERVTATDMMPTPNVAAKNIVSGDERARSMTQNDIQGEREEATFIIRGERGEMGKSQFPTSSFP